MMNYRILIFFIFLGLLINLNLKACKCSSLPIDRNEYVSQGLKNSDVVFFGELISSDSISSKYVFKIIEIFKGNYNRNTIIGKAFTSCSLCPSDKGLWIVYANFKKDSIIDINYCGTSISLKHPYRMIPPPAISEGDFSVKTKYDWKIHEMENKIEGLTTWQYDLYKLRLFKQSCIAEKSNFLIDYKIIIIIISLVLNIYMFTVMIKRKN